ncbi:hypothetical protein C5L27_11000 [Staphylococcus argenteus]|nr:hypothetical protein CKO49_03400 [Staphylococcus argenteus]KAA0799638.1 hypothetical protein DVU64_09115 [Staphylococcus argenteus]MZG26211.1 hypothetical protein [Staphylococcus argenteus]PSJ10446.1 hypothetical protein C7K56_04700 [Staphylococcus argenteus]RRT90670.1 hypothetical protein DPF86_02680 [Staphylococcus argenteus]
MLQAHLHSVNDCKYNNIIEPRTLLYAPFKVASVKNENFEGSISYYFVPNCLIYHHVIINLLI